MKNYGNIILGIKMVEKRKKDFDLRKELEDEGKSSSKSSRDI